MRKIITFFLAILVVSTAFGQGQKVASQSRLNQKANIDSKVRQIMNAAHEMNLMSAGKIAPKSQTNQEVNPNASAAVLAPIELGRASNVYSILRQEQNQVFSNDSLNMVAFIHRQDVNVHGGGTTQNGKYRYDLSIDGGSSFSKDVGILNNTYTRPARYPNLTVFNPGTTSNPFDANIVYVGPVLDPTPGWDGHVNGICDVSASSATCTTENYDFIGKQTLLPGGLIQGLPGEFWVTDVQYNGTNTLDSIYIYKGVYDNQLNKIDWAKHHAIFPPHNKTFDGDQRVNGPNISFSPDGQTGWVGWLGDLIGGHDSVYSPIFVKSTDGGATWGAPIEVDLRTMPWVKDSLQTLWVDSLGNPASTGNPTAAFDFDLTTDVNGNPHIFFNCGSGNTTTSDPGYTISSGLTMFGMDVSSTDGGTTWEGHYIAPILSLRGSFGTPDNDGNLLDMDNVCQISRSEDGTRIFYSWVDSDTTVTGFGVSDNLAPNLRISSRRVTDGFQTCYKLITDTDILWDGKILYPTLAPTVSKKGNTYHMPIVFLDMLANDQLGPTKFWYLGNDALILDSDYMDPATLDLAWGAQCGLFVDRGEELVTPEQVTLHSSYPNPATDVANIKFDLNKASHVNLSISDIYGKTIMIVADANLNAGTHEMSVNTSSIATGVYFYSLVADGVVYSKKMIITH